MAVAQARLQLPEHIRACLEGALVAFQMGRITHPDLVVRIVKTPELPPDAKRALVRNPSLSLFYRLVGEGVEGLTVNLPGGEAITVDPPALVVARTKAKAADVIELTPAAVPWRGGANADLVVVSTAKALSLVADRRLSDMRIYMVDPGRGILDKTLYALAAADGIPISANGVLYVPPNAQPQTRLDLLAAFTGVPLILTQPRSDWDRVRRAVAHWREKGGNLAALASLTDVREADLVLDPFDGRKWYVFTSSASRSADPDIVQALVTEGLDPRVANEVARVGIDAARDPKAFSHLISIIRYHGKDAAGKRRLCRAISRALNIPLDTLLSFAGVTEGA